MEVNGNPVSQTQVNAQNVARAALNSVPETSAEDILKEASDDGMGGLDDTNGKSDDQMGGMDGNNNNNDNDIYIDLNAPNGKNARKVKEGKRKEPESSEEDGQEEENAGGKKGQVGTKIPITAKKRHVPDSGHREKRWSEVKSWQKILKAEEDGECPSDIDELVADAVKTVGKPLKRSYQDKITELKAKGFDDKVAQLVGARTETAKLYNQLEGLHKKLAKSQAHVQQLKNDKTKANVATPEKKKGGKVIAPKQVSEASLDLPPPLQDRPTMTAPMTAMAYVALPDNIIEAGVSMIRATDEKDWPDRARNWVVLAESRPRLEYK